MWWHFSYCLEIQPISFIMANCIKYFLMIVVANTHIFFFYKVYNKFTPRTTTQARFFNHVNHHHPLPFFLKHSCLSFFHSSSYGAFFLYLHPFFHFLQSSILRVFFPKRFIFYHTSY